MVEMLICGKTFEDGDAEMTCVKSFNHRGGCDYKRFVKENVRTENSH